MKKIIFAVKPKKRYDKQNDMLNKRELAIYYMT